MNIKLLTFFIILFLSNYAFANTKNETPNTIPFITYKTSVAYNPNILIPASPSQTQMSASHKLNENQMNTKVTSTDSVIVTQEPELNNIPSTDVQNLITQIRNTVCKSVGDADIKVWMIADASGKLLGLGASTQSGLEVTFHCSGKTS